MFDNNAAKVQYFDFLDQYVDTRKKDTSRERKHAIKQFIIFLNTNNKNIKKIDSNTMLDYVRFLSNYEFYKNTKYAANTIKQRFALVSTFIQFCFEQNIINEHRDRIITSFVKNELPDAEAKIKSYISIKEMNKLFSECKKEHRALFKIMYNTVARVSAIANIKISDINFNEKTIIIYESKSHKQNIISLADTTIQSITEYLSKHRIKPKDTDKEYLFISRNAKKMSIRVIQRIVKTASKRILNKNLTPHRFRDTGITHMLENNANIADVALIASHNNISTTMLYYKQSAKHRKEAMKNTHPLFC